MLKLRIDVEDDVKVMETKNDRMKKKTRDQRERGTRKRKEMEKEA